MTAYHKQPFSRRFGTLGDTAEAIFDLVHPKSHPLGLNRPPFFMGGMPLALRYTPDRLLRDRTVECMGIGRDRKLKIKDEKIQALTMWEALGPVHLFVYDQKAHTYYEAPLAEWVDKLGVHGIARTFDNDGKAYLELGADNFPTQPQPIPEADHADT